MNIVDPELKHTHEEFFYFWIWGLWSGFSGFLVLGGSLAEPTPMSSAEYSSGRVLLAFGFI
jgi:hypothetical protein